MAEATKTYIAKCDLCPDEELRKQGTGPGRLIRRGQKYELTKTQYEKYAPHFVDPKSVATKEAKKKR